LQNARRVEQLARHAVGFCRIEDESPFVSDDRAYLSCKLSDRDFLSCPHIDQPRIRIILHQEHQRVGAILDVQELAPPMHNRP
jgi:hypothetical protein